MICYLVEINRIKEAMVTDFDVVIVGSGLVGLATACALADTGMNIAIVDAKTDIYQDLDPNNCSIRASAINLASKNYFKQVGIWQELEISQRILSFNAIDVFEKQGIAKLQANDTYFSHASLGYIIENQLMINRLYCRALEYSNIHFFNQNVDELSFSSDRGFIYLHNQQKISAKLIIAADGANSSIRNKQQIALLQNPYRHNAIIATVKTELPHKACARQIFYNDGIIAFLPLWQDNMSCLVWSAKPEQANHLLAITDSQFSHDLTEMTENCLGRCEVVSERLFFPLIARYCPKPVQDRLILIGDAAHTIHPLAGQGVNLGLKDSKLLTQLISKNYRAGKDIGLKQYFYHYQLNRSKDALVMLSGMQMIQDVFEGSSTLKKGVRGIGMNIINSTPLIKKNLMKYALGL